MFTKEQLLKIREQSRRQPRVLRKTLSKDDIWRPSVFPVPDEKCKEKSSAGTKCAVLNSWAINNKDDSIYELIVDNCLDFLALTETRCNENNTTSLLYYSYPHTNSWWWCCIDIPRHLQGKTGKYTNFENQIVSLSLGINYPHVTTNYIPSEIFSFDFNEQISDLLSKVLSLTGKRVIIDDFNFRINDPTDTHAAKFKALT